MGKKKEKAKTKKIKKVNAKKNRRLKFKKVLISVIALVVFAATFLIILFFVILPNITKDPKEVNEILSSNGYDFKFIFGQSYYNYAGDCVSGGFFTKKSCTRENLDTYDGGYEIISNANDRPRLYVSGNLIKDNPRMQLDIEKYDDELGATVHAIYINSELAFVEKVGYDDTTCYSQINNKPDWFNEKYSICADEEIPKMNAVAETIPDSIKEMGLTIKDLTNYYENYLEKTGIPIIEKAKQDIEKGLSYMDIRKALEQDGYRFKYNKELDFLSVTSTEIEHKKELGLYTTDGDTFILFYDGKNKVTKLMYKEYNYGWSLGNYLTDSGYTVYWIPDSDEFYGATTDENCMYSIDYPELVSHYDYKCTDEKKKGIDSLAKTFQWSLRSIGITRQELVKFAENYR